MSNQKHETQIVVTEQRPIHSGTNNSGAPYTIYQVIANRQNGELIDLNLRSFEELPKNQLITVTVEKYDNPRYGVSYTVSLKGKKSGLGAKVAKLEADLKVLEQRVAALEQRGGGSSSAPTSVPGTPAGPPPGPPPTPPQSVGSGLPDDVPF